MRRARIAIVLLVMLGTGCASGGTAGSHGQGERHQGLSAWVAEELSPYLAQTLASHPRFKGETVLVVPMRDGRRDPHASQLVRDLARQLNETLLQAPGIRLGWDSAADGDACPHESPVHYLLGLQIDTAAAGRYRAGLKALDLEDGQWVSGFGRNWTGRLDALEQASLARDAVDEGLRGQRELPFSAGQTDLLAQALAARLWCAMGRYGQQDLKIWVAQDADGQLEPEAGFDPALTRLVANYLGRGRAVQLVPAPGEAEAVLRVRRQAVHGDLYQAWATLRAAPGADTSLALDSEVYVSAPASTLARAAAEPPSPAGAAPADPGLIREVRLMVPRAASQCAAANPWERGVRLLPPRRGPDPGTCYGLHMDLQPSSRVVLLRQESDGLCRIGSAVAPASGRVRWPLDRAVPTAGQRAQARYYLLAWTDAEAGRATQAILEVLPAGCERGARAPPGGLAAWTRQLDSLALRYPDRIHWQRLSVGSDG